MPSIVEKEARRDALLAYKEEKLKEGASTSSPSGGNVSQGDEREAAGEETETSLDAPEIQESEFLKGEKDGDSKGEKSAQKSPAKSNSKAPAKKSFFGKVEQFVKDALTFVVNTIFNGIYHAYKFQQSMSQLRDSNMGVDEAQNEADKLTKEIEKEEAKRREMQAARRAALKEKYGSVWGFLQKAPREMISDIKEIYSQPTIFSQMFKQMFSKKPQAQKEKQGEEPSAEEQGEETRSSKEEQTTKPTVQIDHNDLKDVMIIMKEDIVHNHEGASGSEVKDHRENQNRSGHESTV